MLDIQVGRGLICSFLTKAPEVVSALQFLPDLDCLCSLHFRHNKIWLYSDEGDILASSPLPKLNNPSGLTSLKSKQNSVIIADIGSKSLHVVTFQKSEGSITIMITDHCIYQLNFRPADVSSFCTRKRQLLVVLCIDNAVLHFLTEDGKYLQDIQICTPINLSYATAVDENRILVIDSTDCKGALHWVNTKGQVVQTYGWDGQRSNYLLDDPMDVIVDSMTGNVLVTDKNGIQLIDREGNFLQLLVDAKDGVTLPRRMCLDRRQGKSRLFVGFGQAMFDVRIRVYDYEALCSRMEEIFEKDGVDSKGISKLSA